MRENGNAVGESSTPRDGRNFTAKRCLTSKVCVSPPAPWTSCLGSRTTSADPAVTSSIVRGVIAVYRSRNEHGPRRHDHRRSRDYRGGDRQENAAREAHGDNSHPEQRSRI